MTQQRIKQIHRIYGILLSLSLVVAAVLLIVACVGIYRAGGNPVFSREKVAAAFAPIAIPVYLAVALTVGGAVLHLLLPAEAVRLRANVAPETALARLYSRATLTEEQQAAVKKEQRMRCLHIFLTAVLVLAGTMVFLVYALNGAHFPLPDRIKEELNSAMIQAMWWLLPCVAVPMGYGIFTVFYCRRSRQRELSIVKSADLSAKGEDAPAVKRAFPVTAVRLALLGAGLLMLGYGFATGGIADVLTKAVNICTECIGLG